MTGEVEALVAACLADLDDDAPILVLCDYLDERGDRRGWLLRRYFKISRRRRYHCEVGIAHVEELYAGWMTRGLDRAKLLERNRWELFKVGARFRMWFERYFAGGP